MKSAAIKSQTTTGTPQIPRTPVLSRWLPLAIVISLLAHITFLAWTRTILWSEPTIPSPSPPAEPVRPFRLIKPPETYPIPPAKNVQKSASLKKPLALPVDEMEPRPEAGTLPFQDLVSPPKMNAALLQEKPGAVGSSLNPAIQNTLSEGIRRADQRMDSFQEQLLQDHPKSATQAVTQLVQPNAAGEAAELAAAGRRPGSAPTGFSNLDDLLSQTGPLRSDTAPILMPTDLLFDYDNAELRDQALGSLRKLGTLIQRNPQATFLIEGHTDSFGTDAYNMDLSLRRAEAVKTWLVQVMGIAPSRIETKGFGKTRLLAPASGTIEQQQINRRVEIIIHVPKQ